MFKNRGGEIKRDEWMKVDYAEFKPINEQIILWSDFASHLRYLFFSYYLLIEY